MHCKLAADGALSEIFFGSNFFHPDASDSYADTGTQRELSAREKKCHETRGVVDVLKFA